MNIEHIDHPAFKTAVAAFGSPERRQAWEKSIRGRWQAGMFPDDWDATWELVVQEMTWAAGSRFEAWMARTPTRYRAAALGDLEPDQHPDDIDRWMSSPESSTLILAGASGRGKTWAAYAAAHALAAAASVSRVQLPAAWTVAGLLDALRPSSGDAEQVWAAVKSAPVLLLDDLANVRATDWSVERMWVLADARTSNDLRTIITTNASWPDLTAAWGVPTMDRYRDRAATVAFTGPSMRAPAW